MAANVGSGGYWTKADKEEREWYLSRIEPEDSRLLQNETTAAQAMTSMLFGVNAGGAVAMLAYVSSDHAQVPHPYTVLIAFVVGLVVALVLAILGYYSTQTMLARWTGVLLSSTRATSIGVLSGIQKRHRTGGCIPVSCMRLAGLRCFPSYSGRASVSIKCGSFRVHD